MALPYEVQHSRRRKRTVGWQIRAGRLIITLPAGMATAEQARWVEEIRRRAEARYDRAVRGTDAELFERARQFADRYFPGVTVRGARWIQAATRWGSCSPDIGVVRLNVRLQELPAWVQDYVLVHELAHLIEANHSERFWALVNRYPLTERARGFLLGIEHRDALPGEEVDSR